MKRLLLPLLAAITLVAPANAFGKYKSQIEAKEACDKWAAKGSKFTAEETIYVEQEPEFAYKGWKHKLVGKEGINRKCELENTTNQYLGYEATKIKKGQHYKEYVYENMDKGLKIKKYFKF
tara:strand:+ start:154 stop:516 length:363 start_codon:yes stop_codon:yes gene_type:complete